MADLAWPKGYAIPYSIMLSNNDGVKEERGEYVKWWHSSSEVIITHNKPCFLEVTEHLSACQWEEVNEVFVLLGQLAFALPSFWVNPLVLTILPSQFSLPSHLGRASKQLYGTESTGWLSHNKHRLSMAHCGTLFFLSYRGLQAMSLLEVSVCHCLCLQILINSTYLPN